MKLIQSRENPLVKSLHKLAAGKHRDGRVLLDGVHLCQEWLTRHGQPEYALFDAARLEKPELRALAEQVEDAHAIALDSALMKGVAEVESGQGVAFVVQAPAPALPDLIDENCVLLDRVQDPGNVGTVLRACAAAGIKRVFLGQGCAQAWSAKVLRSGQGAHFALTIHEHCDALALIERAQVPVVATALPASVSLYEADLPARCMWVFGHEGQGVAESILQRAALRVVIPHEAAVESLNVAMAATLCLFEQRRRAAA